MIVTTALLALVACGASDISTGDSGSDSGNTGSDSGTTGNNGSDEAPELQSVEARCSYQSSGESYYLWVLEAYVDDPQGRDTIETNQTVEVYRGGSLQASYGLICGAANPCIGSFKEAQNGILCDSASDYEFRFLITDEDGNTSTKEVPGYQG